MADGLAGDGLAADEARDGVGAVARRVLAALDGRRQIAGFLLPGDLCEGVDVLVEGVEARPHEVDGEIGHSQLPPCLSVIGPLVGAHRPDRPQAGLSVRHHRLRDRHLAVHPRRRGQ